MKRSLSVATSILRGYDYSQVRDVVSTLAGSKVVGNVEITLNTGDAIETIRKISDEFGHQINVGAGTVLDYHHLVLACEAGATFVLAPDAMTCEMLEYCQNHDVVSVPGAFTPSEIREQFRRGADVVKVFPANELSHGYAKKVCEPLGNLPLMAVGGVNAENVGEVLDSGYSYVGSAGGIFKRQDILSHNTTGMKESLTAFEAAVLAR
jgi:2-dehydro-3-deoxyphosphogluconate aldolase/(4S)-4-hydroxy-2-oxoglutarate aldolase